jgi:hypothetical protein
MFQRPLFSAFQACKAISATAAERNLCFANSRVKPAYFPSAERLEEALDIGRIESGSGIAARFVDLRDQRLLAPL